MTFVYQKKPGEKDPVMVGVFHDDDQAQKWIKEQEIKGITGFTTVAK
ncbi:MAG: hypothetical protein IJ950_08445 [Helicobacter sp.]|nr:hypothetical protein [Helicobacter sp.]